jgi:integrase
VASGSLQAKGENKWRLVVTLPRDPAGKYPQITRTFHGTKKLAQAELRKMLAEHEGRARPSKVSVADVLEQWLHHITARGRSATTIYNYRGRIRNDINPAIGHLDVRRLTVHDLDNLYTKMSKQEKGGSPRSIAQVHAIIRAALNYAEKRELVTRNVATHADLPPIKPKDPTVPDPADVQRLLDLAYRLDPDMAVAFRVAATTGARRGSVAALRSDDLSFTDGTIRIARSVVAIPGQPTHEKAIKANRGRPVAVDTETMQLLADHIVRLHERAEKAGTRLVDNFYLFSSRADGGEPPRPDALTTAFMAARRKAGLPHVRLHDLRHFVPTQLFALGYDAVTIADRLIHASPKMTLDVYSHVVSDRARSAADAMGAVLRSAEKQSAPD